MSSIARDGILNEDGDRSANKSSRHHRRDRDDDRTRSASPAEQVKDEDGGPDVRMADAKPTYKSWKKKYRKMRIRFDNLQAQNEELYQMEQRALAKTKQLAIHNDRMLDLLLDTNNCRQMPTEKRYDLSLPIPSDVEEDCILSVDREPKSGPRPVKDLRELIQEVPHLDFAATVERFPDVANELLTGIDSPAADAAHQQHPPAMLTADDIDNYLWEIDNRIAREPEVYGGGLSELLPTLAPLAREQQHGATPVPVVHSKAGASSVSTASRDFALRNPTSVYNWLRKHAPKTFLQDHEGGDDKKEKSHHRKATRAEDDDEDEEKRPAAKKGAGGGARKSSGEGRGSIAVARAKAKNERSSKRSTAAQAKDKRKSLDTTMVDAEDEIGYNEPAPTKGKRKRPADDDTGYRPKGGSSRRPTKKQSKHNSIGGGLAGVAEGDEKADVAVAKGADKIQAEVEATARGSEAED